MFLLYLFFSSYEFHGHGVLRRHHRRGVLQGTKPNRGHSKHERGTNAMETYHA